MILNWLIKKIFGDPNARRIKKMRPVVEKINQIYDSYRSLTDDQLKAKTAEFKERLKNGETTDDLLPEAFAVVKDACRRLCGTKITVTGHEMTWDMIPFDVQLMGGMALHNHHIAEMATGEGKTLVAVMPLYLNALTGRNCQLVTVNDYLARRDSEWMGTVLKWLGLTVGCIQNEMNPAQRREQYNCDITYGTNSEFGFDYLRDMGMAMNREELVQRDHFFVIIDEIDSILIDEARTPLIIAGPAKVSTHQFDKYKPMVAALYEQQTRLIDKMIAEADAVVQNESSTPEDLEDAYLTLAKAQMGLPKHPRLMQLMQDATIRKALDRKDLEIHSDNNRGFLQRCKEELYFSIDERNSEADLSEKGRKFLRPGEKDAFVVPDLPSQLSAIDADTTLTENEKVEKRKQYQIEFDEKTEIIHDISQLLRAYCLFQRDVQYMVQDNKVIIVDEFTGRAQPGRRFSEGLHQALEAKEGVTIERETQTLASITIQNYFRMYEKLAGMTGTAETEANEFKSIYNLDVAVIPTNKPCQRIDDNDPVYKTQKAKYRAIIQEIIECHKRGQPVLVGTISVEVSEILSRMLDQQKIVHNVLNAKHHASEAEIVARAGQIGQVTIATNMAGRGTDIKLAPGVKELGGLRVIGSERHDSRRIDRQLRGRCARQGDPGSSRFYVSLEDNLMRLFASDRVANILERLGMGEDDELSHPMLNRTIENAQQRVEQQHFSIRKRTLQYDDVMNRQRQTVYGLRKSILMTDDTRDLLMDFIYTTLADRVDAIYAARVKHEHIDLAPLREWLQRVFPVSFPQELLEETGDPDELPGKDDAERAETRSHALMKCIEDVYNARAANFPPEAITWLERYIMLNGIDQLYQEHLYAMDDLRNSVHLRSYAQRDPLVEYKQEAFKMFDSLMTRIREEICQDTFRISPVIIQAPAEQQGRREEERTAASSVAESSEIEQLKRQLGHKPRQTVTNQQDFDSLLNESQSAASPPPGRGSTTIRRQEAKVGRNDPCPCGSGKKYKNCHGRGV
ncbi:MAG: preprotein translocase subunit SecA [Victivallales bacterium]|nr:preprotein translocase subunit SecA [Victivallales bacterium]